MADGAAMTREVAITPACTSEAINSRVAIRIRDGFTVFMETINTISPFIC